MVEHFCVKMVILAAAVFYISCGKTDRHTNRQTDKLYPRDFCQRGRG